MPKKIVLIEPIKGSIDVDQYLRDCSDYHSGGSTEIRDPICLEYIAGYIEKHGYDTVIIQQKEKSNEEVASLTVKEKPFAVGISSLAYNFYSALDIANKIKSLNSNVIIIFGGYQPSANPSILENKSIDYVVIGEGEETFKELLDNISNKGNLKNVKSIAYTSNGKIIVNEPRTRLDLSKLPWPKRAAELLKGCAHSGLTYPPPNKQISAAQVTYSRGCPHDCPFCSSPRLWGMKIEYREPKEVVNEIKYLKEKFGTNFVFFTDLTFNANKDKVFELCEKIINTKLNINWFAMSRLEDDFDTAKIMKDSGCSVLGFGVESLIDYSLSKIKPMQNFEKIKTMLQVTDSVGISNRCYFMIGYPWETKESLTELLDRMKQLNIDSLRMNFIAPFPGTKLFEEWKDRLSTDLSRYTGQEPVVKCDKISEEELLNARDRLVKEYFMSKEYRNICKNKIKRFPEWKESYIYFFNYLRRAGINVSLE